jgi:hypothetical protein
MCSFHACNLPTYTLEAALRLVHQQQRLPRNPESMTADFQLIRDLCRNSGCLPKAFYMSGVDFDSGRDPIACSVFTDVYRGLFNKQEVAVKRVRIAGGPVDREPFSKVRVSCLVDAALF